MRVVKKVGVLLMFLISSVACMGDAGSGDNNLVITKDINFEVEVGTVIDLDLDPVDINFGNIVRNSNDTVTRTSYLKFKQAFTKDNKVTTSFPEETNKDVNNEYAMFELDYQQPEEKPKEATTEKTTLPVYIKRVKDMLVRKGEIQIPITAEIRGVPKDQKLGLYKKNIKMNVMTTPIDPAKAVRTSGEGGMR